MPFNASRLASFPAALTTADACFSISKQRCNSNSAEQAAPNVMQGSGHLVEAGQDCPGQLVDQRGARATGLHTKAQPKPVRNAD